MTAVELGDATWWLVVLVVVVLAAIAYGVGYAILRSAAYAQPTMLVLALSLLTVLMLAVFVATDESDVLALAGVGLGALAGAVNAMFNNRPPD